MTKPDDAAYIVIGRLGAAYGVHGWIKVHVFTEEVDNILAYSPWYIATDHTSNAWRSIAVEDSKNHGKGIIVKLADYASPETVRELTGLWVGIQRSQLPALADNQYYWSDLIGLTVINQHGLTLGHVAYLIETGSNDVLVVKDGKKEEAIPYLLNSVITSIDLAKKEVHVNWESL